MERIVLNKELQDLDAQITGLGSLVENALTQALEALEKGDQDESGTVIMADNSIDDLHMTIEKHAFRVLALQQPLVGRDLRYVVSLVPITIDLERIGDDAEGIAQFVLRMMPFQRDPVHEVPESSNLTSTPEEPAQPAEDAPLYDILDLGHDVRQLLQATMKAFTDRDAAAARSLWDKDRIVDRHSSRIRRDVMNMLEGRYAIASLAHDPHMLQRLSYLLWIAYKLERVADHCTNICERIAFIVEGETDIRPVPELE